MSLGRELTDLSLPRIGQAFGGRDHTVVMHADRKIRQQMTERRSLYNQIAELTSRIRSSGEPGDDIEPADGRSEDAGTASAEHGVRQARQAIADRRLEQARTHLVEA